jgi:hypothetical protein
MKESINKCDPDIHNTLKKNIILKGDGLCYEGFEERIKKEDFFKKSKLPFFYDDINYRKYFFFYYNLVIPLGMVLHLLQAFQDFMKFGYQKMNMLNLDLK